MTSDRNTQLRTFVTYLVFGGVTSLFCVFVGAVIFQWAPQLDFALINLLAGALGIVVNFVLNFFFNFGGPAKSSGAAQEFLRFAFVAVAGIALAYLLSAVLHATFEAVYPDSGALESSLIMRSLAHGLVLIVVAIVSYAGHIAFTFRRRGSG